MRRDSTNQKNIKLILLFIVLVIYQSLTSVHPFLSPLFGLVFLYSLKISETKDTLIKFLILFYVIIYEIDKDFILLSYLLFFIFSKRFVIEIIERYIGCYICKVSIYVTYAYLGYYALNLLFSSMFSQFVPYLGIEYLFYILTDTILVMIFMHEK